MHIRRRLQPPSDGNGTRMAARKSAKKQARSIERERGGFKASRHGSTAGGPKAEQKRAAEEREQTAVTSTRAGGAQSTPHPTAKSRFLRGQRIDPRPIDGSESAADLIDR